MKLSWCMLLVFAALTFSPGTAVSDEAGPGGVPASPLPSKSGRTAAKKVTIKAILNRPDAFEDKNIVLEGAFRGWSGKCAGSSMLTRSDWVLDDGTGCIYVTGRIPAGVSPANPKGERLALSGRVKTDKKGKPFFEAKEARRLPTKLLQH